MELFPVRRESRLILFIILFLPLTVTLPQINKLDKNDLEQTMRNPFKADRSVFISDWLVLGTIPVNSMNDLDKDFFAGEKGEENTRPIKDQSADIQGGKYTWKELKGKEIIDLKEFFRDGKTEDAAAYAYSKISRLKAGKVFFYLGNDDGIKIWLNGKLIHKVSEARSLKMDEDVFEGNMIAGENHLLLKTLKRKGNWSFVLRMAEDKNQFNVIKGNIEFSIAGVDSVARTIKIVSAGNLDQNLMKQEIAIEVYKVGGKTVSEKTFECFHPVILNYDDWEDGPYEFRFTYKNIKGTKIMKYIPWYKGDILAEVNKIIKSAPDKSVRNPEASLHRMLADMILFKLGNNLQNPDSAKFATICSPIMEFEESKTNQQIRPGGFVRLAYIDDIDNTPQFCLCFIPFNYDPAKKWPMAVFLHGYIPNIPEYEQIPYMDSRHYEISDTQNVIFIEPFGRGDAGYTGIGERDVLKCIDLAKQTLSVDEDRVYLMGQSMGGYGTWNVATRHPELFAAISPMLGGGDYHVSFPKEKLEKMSGWQTFLQDKSSSTAQLESLLNMPILVSHGDQDQSVDVNLSRYIVRMLQRWNYNVRYIEVPGMGHTDLGLQGQIISWMLQYKRNNAPKCVRIRAADLKTASAYWVKVNRRLNPIDFIVADAEVLENNIIRVDSKNAEEIELFVPAGLVDYDKAIKVVWNGDIIVSENSKGGKIIIKSKEAKYGSSNKSPHIAGPIADYQNTPYMIVAGTISKDSTMRKMILQKADMIVKEWKAGQKYEPRFKNDVDVTESDMKDYTLFLLGGVNENKVTLNISEKIPFRVQPGDITIGEKSFKVNDAVLNAIYPSPFNKERYIVLAAANSSAGFFFLNVWMNDLKQYDFYIADGKIPNFSAGATDEKILPASGFFNSNWEIDKSHINEGSGELRSKCASLAINNDLSTRVVGTENPSGELLKSYTGIYQMEEGFKLKSFIENGKLKISAVPGDRAFELESVSKCEFYNKDGNFSVGFKKEESAKDYSLVLYEWGSEYTLKKIE
ncbi:MAG: prolyl oligopeptidase family serine peptidase [Ignavibacteriaceae bacterium]|nr:prolyl oligopeptidase family serine peptidase [Ignavibacteriaceae bacterium]